MNKTGQHLLLADDDFDDCSFFKEALDDLPVQATLSIVNDGVALMDFLSAENTAPPDLLFLDLNMPRKSGFECLEEIKGHDNLKDLPVIICSTSLDVDVVNTLYEKGAQYYIQKPAEFSKLKKVIHDALVISSQENSVQPPRDKFVLHP